MKLNLASTQRIKALQRNEQPCALQGRDLSHTIFSHNQSSTGVQIYPRIISIPKEFRSILV
jgi:hypothetical protein